jgi:hypothetical protein
MAGVVVVIWGSREAEYFCVRDWTGQIALKQLKKIASTRRNYGYRNRVDGATQQPYQKAVDERHRRNVS